MQNFLAYGPVATMSGALIAEALEITPTMPPQVLPGGAMAVLAWTIWYVLARVLPRHDATVLALTNAFLAKLHEKDG